MLKTCCIIKYFPSKGGVENKLKLNESSNYIFLFLYDIYVSYPHLFVRHAWVGCSIENITLLMNMLVNWHYITLLYYFILGAQIRLMRCIIHQYKVKSTHILFYSNNKDE